MRANPKVLALYRLLRAQFGKTVAAGELLAIAQELAQQYQKIDSEDNRANAAQVRLRIPFVATDDAFRDQSWEILEFEHMNQADPDMWTRERARRATERVRRIMDNL